MTDKLVLAGKEFDSRLIIGTGKYASGAALTASAKASLNNNSFSIMFLPYING